jgi:hypothetical protein
MTIIEGLNKTFKSILIWSRSYDYQYRKRQGGNRQNDGGNQSGGVARIGGSAAGL